MNRLESTVSINPCSEFPLWLSRPMILPSPPCSGPWKAHLSREHPQASSPSNSDRVQPVKRQARELACFTVQSVPPQDLEWYHPLLNPGPSSRPPYVSVALLSLESHCPSLQLSIGWRPALFPWKFSGSRIGWFRAKSTKWLYFLFKDQLCSITRCLRKWQPHAAYLPFTWAYIGKTHQ